MPAGLIADLLLVLHLGFILFVLAGGVLALRSLRWAWLHLPAVAWAVWIEWSGGICPLTPWEVHFRHLAGESGFDEGFVAHYLVPLIYPPGLTPELQWLLGLGVLVLNAGVYGWALSRPR